MDGWIKIHRQALENPIMRKPNYWAVWCYLLLNANYKDNYFISKEGKHLISRGQLLTSKRKIADYLNLSSGTVQYILQYLELEHMIEQKSTSKWTVIEVKNYSKYQEVEQEVENKVSFKKTQSESKVRQLIKKESKKDKNLVTNVTNEISTQSLSINDLFGLFSSVNPSYKTLYPMKGQRQALERLVNEHGRERVVLLIKGAEYAHGKPYAPTITTPYELEKKLGVLTAYLKKEQWEDDNYKFNVTKV
jgi:DNA-binding transcriptional regulator YhcF (GntR family)